MSDDYDYADDNPPVVPQTFHQLGILVLDGSGSMIAKTVDKITKAQAVERAVKGLLSKLAESGVAANFSIAMVTFGTTATLHTPPTSVTTIDRQANYDPMVGHGEGTDIEVGLRLAQKVASEFRADAESVPRSVVVIVMSDGKTGGNPKVVADELKHAGITVCTALFVAVGEADDVDSQALLEELATSHEYYRTAYQAEDLRKFFIASVAAGMDVTIA